MSIIDVLTKGPFIKPFSILLLLIAASLSVISGILGDDNTSLVLFLIIFPNMCLMTITTHRMTLLSQHQMAQMLPNYYSELKSALKKILLFSLLTTVILLPNIAMALSLMTWLLVLFLFLILSHLKPQMSLIFNILFWTIIFVSFKFSLGQTNDWLWQTPAYFLPFILFLAYQTIERLDQFKISENVKFRLSVSSNFSWLGNLSHMGKSPEKSRTKIYQQTIDIDLMALRKQINKNEKINKFTLVNIASLNVNRFGKAALIVLSSIAMLLFFYSQIYPLSTKHLGFLLPLFLIFSVLTVPMELITSFLALNERKEYLARLRLMPLFVDEQEFTYLILKVFFFNQGRLLLFIVAYSAMIIFIFFPDSIEMLANIIAINMLSFFLFSALVLFGWHTKKQIKLLILIIMAFFLFVFAITISNIHNRHSLLFNSDTFNELIAASFILLLLSLLKWKSKPPSWKKLT